MGATLRKSDPCGGSTKTTSAPRSDRSLPHNSLRLFVVSTARKPSSGRSTSYLLAQPTLETSVADSEYSAKWKYSSIFEIMR